MTDLRFKQFLPGLAIFVVSLGLVSCSLTDRRAEQNTYTPPAELREEVSLKADRSELDSLRKDVPVAVQRENDELAFFLKMMETETKPPSRIRSRFNTLYNRKKNRFRKIRDRERSRFNKEENQLKKDFLEEQKKERDSFYRGDPERDEMRDFSRDQDEERRRFFANQRDRRKDFQDQMKDLARDFNDNMNDLRRDFQDAYREYQKRYNENKKREVLDKTAPQQSNANHPYKKDFEAMDGKKRESLKAGDN